MKKPLVLSLILVIAITVFVAPNLIVPKQAEAILPDPAIRLMWRSACCDFYASYHCPKDLYRVCFWDCMDQAGCDTEL